MPTQKIWVSDCCRTNPDGHSLDGSLGINSADALALQNAAESGGRRRVRSHRCKRHRHSNRHHHGEDTGPDTPTAQEESLTTAGANNFMQATLHDTLATSGASFQNLPLMNEQQQQQPHQQHLLLMQQQQPQQQQFLNSTAIARTPYQVRDRSGAGLLHNTLAGTVSATITSSNHQRSLSPISRNQSTITSGPVFNRSTSPSPVSGPVTGMNRAMSGTTSRGLTMQQWIEQQQQQQQLQQQQQHQQQTQMASSGAGAAVASSNTHWSFQGSFAPGTVPVSPGTVPVSAGAASGNIGGASPTVISPVWASGVSRREEKMVTQVSESTGGDKMVVSTSISGPVPTPEQVPEGSLQNEMGVQTSGVSLEQLHKMQQTGTVPQESGNGNGMHACNTTTNMHATSTITTTGEVNTTGLATISGSQRKILWEQRRPISASEVTAAHVELSRRDVVSTRRNNVTKPVVGGDATTRVVQETVLHEDVVEETQLVRERIVEVARPVVREKLVASNAEVVETLVEDRLDVETEKVEIREIEQLHEVQTPVLRECISEKVIEIPEVEIQKVDVIRKYDVTSFKEEVVFKEKPVVQYRDKFVPEVKNVKVVQELTRLVPIPVEQRTHVTIKLPTAIPVYEKITFPVYLPRFVEVPLHADATPAVSSDGENFTAKCAAVSSSVAQLARAAQLQSVSLCKLEAVGVEAKQWELQVDQLLTDLSSEYHSKKLTELWRGGSLKLQREDTGDVIVANGLVTSASHHSIGGFNSNFVVSAGSPKMNADLPSPPLNLNVAFRGGQAISATHAAHTSTTTTATTTTMAANSSQSRVMSGTGPNVAAVHGTAISTGTSLPQHVAPHWAFSGGALSPKSLSEYSTSPRAENTTTTVSNSLLATNSTTINKSFGTGATTRTPSESRRTTNDFSDSGNDVADDSERDTDEGSASLLERTLVSQTVGSVEAAESGLLADHITPRLSFHEKSSSGNHSTSTRDNTTRPGNTNAMFFDQGDIADDTDDTNDED